LSDQSPWSLSNFYDLALKLNLPELVDKILYLEEETANFEEEEMHIQRLQDPETKERELGITCQRRITVAMTSGFVMRHLLVEEGTKPISLI
jgi:hypothetical protein